MCPKNYGKCEQDQSLNASSWREKNADLFLPFRFQKRWKKRWKKEKVWITRDLASSPRPRQRLVTNSQSRLVTWGGISSGVQMWLVISRWYVKGRELRGKLKSSHFYKRDASWVNCMYICNFCDLRSFVSLQEICSQETRAEWGKTQILQRRNKEMMFDRFGTNLLTWS